MENPQPYVERINKLIVDLRGDTDDLHMQCDFVLIEFLEKAAPELAAAWQKARESTEGGDFWWA